MTLAWDAGPTVRFEPVSAVHGHTVFECFFKTGMLMGVWMVCADDTRFVRSLSWGQTDGKWWCSYAGAEEMKLGGGYISKSFLYVIGCA